ncbi:MAG: alpha/beta-hydrolase N-terminal domain-containing protein, partial [Actinomycetes bacterium]
SCSGAHRIWSSRVKAATEQSSGTSMHFTDRWGRFVARLPRYGWAGVLFGVLLAASSFTPSLLPRTPLLQALLAGVVGAFGYGVGPPRGFGAPLGGFRETWDGLGKSWTLLYASGTHATTIGVSRDGWVAARRLGSRATAG